MTKNLTANNKFGRTVLALVLPLAFQNLINVAVNAADVFMLQMIGETSLSAASMAGQVFFILSLIFFGLTSGASVLTAQYWGKKDNRTVERVLGMSVKFSVCISVIFFVAAFFFTRPIMGILTDVPAVIDEAIPYLRIMAFTYPIIAVSMICLNIMRSVERVNISTVVYIVSLFTNIILNLLFIKGWLGFPKLGIVGVAIATLTARVVELVITLVYMRRNKIIRLRIKDIFRSNRLLTRDFISFSLPVVVNELLWGLAISVSATVIGHMGQAAIAAQSVATTVRQLAMVVVFGIANATAIIVGKEVGANRMENAKLYSKKLMKFGIIAGLCGSALMLALAPIVPRLMSNLSAEATKYLTFMMVSLALYVVCGSVSATAIVGVFRAGGDTKVGLLVDIGTLWGICIPAGCLAAFVFNWDVRIVFSLLICDELLKCPIVVWRFKSMKWLRNVTRDEVTAQTNAEPA